PEPSGDALAAMPEALAEAAPAQRGLLERFTRAAVLACLAVTLVIYLLAVPALAFRWQQQAFLGGLVERTMVFNNVWAGGERPWPAFAAGVQPGDHLQTVAGVPVASAADISRALAGKAAGQAVTLTLLRNGQTATVTATLTSFPASAFVSLF